MHEFAYALLDSFTKKMQKQKQKILFIELKFGALVSEMAQKPKGRQCVDKKARHFAKVKVDKTTKPYCVHSKVCLRLEFRSYFQCEL